MPIGIIIVGLGPGDPGLLTVDARHALQSAREIYLRTRKHPTVDALPSSADVHSFDDVYEHAETFEEVYSEIASSILELGRRPLGVVYAVPGHPLVGEASVRRILTLADQNSVPVRIVEGLSFLEPVCTLLRLDPVDGLQIVDGTAMANVHYPDCNPDRPLLVSQLYDRSVAADVKLALLEVYPDDHKVKLVRSAGTANGTVHAMPLYDLDRCEEIDHLTSLYVPPLAEAGSLASFQELVAHLRSPGGCPWDQEQTHRLLRPFLLEEAYEVLEALDNDDVVSLKEELGDLMLQILLHAQIAIEQQEFKMADVVAHIVAKLKRRHPHVFGDAQVSNAQEVLVNWERIKLGEKGHVHQDGALSGVPASLPALSRAQSLQRRAAQAGFDWPEIEGVRAKVEEEWQELREATTAEAQEGELGDALFSLVNLARWLGVDAESALRQATGRFEKRFLLMERECASRGQRLAELGPKELDDLWEAAKKRDG